MLMWCRAKELILARMPFPRDDGGAHRVVRRVDAHRALAHVDHGAQVPLDHAVGAQGLGAHAHDLLARELRLEQAHLAGVEQAVDVLAQAEHVRVAVGPLVGADAFEGGQSVVQRVGEDVDLGVVPVDELSVEPDLLDLVDHEGAPPWSGIRGECRAA